MQLILKPRRATGATFALMPPSATADARRLLVTRGLRGLADGAVSVLLADYLSTIGPSPRQIGAIITGIAMADEKRMAAALAHPVEGEPDGGKG